MVQVALTGNILIKGHRKYYACSETKTAQGQGGSVKRGRFKPKQMDGIETGSVLYIGTDVEKGSGGYIGTGVDTGVDTGLGGYIGIGVDIDMGVDIGA